MIRLLQPLKSVFLNMSSIFVSCLGLQFSSGVLNAFALANICRMLRTLLTSHESRSRLKFVAPSNISTMLLTLETFQWLIFPLNLVASRNMFLIPTTFFTSHERRRRLKFVALRNIPVMLVTLATSQSLIFPLNLVYLPRNMFFISATFFTSHELRSWLKFVA